jgi:serine/threonine protein kinase
MRLGTPSYMAPEQFDDDAEVGKPADVFAWGGLLVFVTTGRPPFGTASNLKEVDVLAHRIATREPKLDEFEEPLRPLVRAAMAKNPDRRPTARELVRRLSSGGQATPAGAAPTMAEPAPSDSAPAATAPVPAPAFAAPVRPRPLGPPPPLPSGRTAAGSQPTSGRTAPEQCRRGRPCWSASASPSAWSLFFCSAG